MYRIGHSAKEEAISEVSRGGYAENYDAVIARLKSNFPEDETTGLIGGHILGAEIGVRYGYFTEALYKACTNIHMTCVDPYAPYQDVHKYMGATEQLAIMQTAFDRLSKYKPNILVLPSTEAADLVPDRSLDFVFIDGNHSYHAVKADLMAWFPKVKSGGFMSGHDFEMPEVNRAVKEFWRVYHDVFETFYHYELPADVWAFSVVRE